jgi:hypothetical protein
MEQNKIDKLKRYYGIRNMLIESFGPEDPTVHHINKHITKLKIERYREIRDMHAEMFGPDDHLVLTIDEYITKLENGEIEEPIFVCE